MTSQCILPLALGLPGEEYEYLASPPHVGMHPPVPLFRGALQQVAYLLPEQLDATDVLEVADGLRLLPLHVPPHS